MEQTISQERHPTHQQSDDGQEIGLTSPIASGGQAIFQQSGSGRGNDLNHSLLNGVEVVPRQESTSIQKPGQSQLVNGQHQPRFQVSAQANGLSYSTQEIGQDTHQRQDRPEVTYPIQETGASTERTPVEHEDLPPNHPQLDGADINGVSSTGEREHAVEHSCCCQELQLWRQECDR